MHNQPPQEHPKPSHPTPQPTDQKHRSHEGLLSVMGTILLLVAAPLIAVIFTMFIFQSYEVDGPSMQNTLHHQDRLIVYKLPKTISRITKKPYIPKRGEIVVFEREDLSNGEFGHEGGKQLIKRVIGLPGERVVVSEGQIHVYNTEHPDGFDPDAGTSYESNIESTPGDVDITVPENEVFVAGDNRNNSLDSRYFGTVPVDELVGELVIRLWPSAKTF